MKAAGGHVTIGIDVMERRNPSPAPPERPVSLTDPRTNEPAGNVFDDDSVISAPIPARFVHEAAAFSLTDGVVSPGGIGFDINCGW